MTCVRKVIDAMTATLAHFKFSDQLIGFLGSSGPSQSTMFGSASALVVPGSCFLESSLAWPASRSIFSSKLALLGDPFPFAGPVEAGFFSGSVLLASRGIEDVASSGAGARLASASVDNFASGEENGAASEPGAGTASGFVEAIVPDAAAPDVAPCIVSCSVDAFAFGADEDASAT